jgi:hypothetical protein
LEAPRSVDGNIHRGLAADPDGLGGDDRRIATPAAVCSVFDKRPCAPTVCPLHQRRPCIPESGTRSARICLTIEPAGRGFRR